MNAKRPGLHLSGPWSYRRRGLVLWAKVPVQVALRRARHGPLLEGWSYGFESAVEFLRRRMAEAFALPTVEAQRCYLDALVFRSKVQTQVATVPVKDAPVSGRWFIPQHTPHPGAVLYLHGGGYAYFARNHDDLIARFALTAGAKTFALDYPLAPEHPFPAQLQAASAAYHWLLNQGLTPRQLVLAGDSAGGNLALATLLALREARSPLPAQTICLCPWTDLTNSGASMSANARYDWIQQAMADCWAEWLGAGNNLAHPLFSPINADLRALPPIYIQAGRAEILYDMIRSFAEKARSQGSPVELEVWPNMVHDFQAFGRSVPQSAQAWDRLGQVLRRAFQSE